MEQERIVIAAIAFETASLKTLLVYAVVLLFSLGVLTVILTSEDEKGAGAGGEQMKSQESIVVLKDEACKQMEGIPSEEIVLEENVSREVTYEETTVVEPEPIIVLETVVEIDEPTPEVEESRPNQSTEEDEVRVPEPVVEVEPVVEIEPAKTPKRKPTRHHETTPPSSPPLPMSPRRSERKAKKPVLFDPSRR
jgi:hypothetical protein